MVLIVLHKSYFFTNIALKLILIKNMACNSITPQIEDLAKRLKVTPQEASNIVSLYQSQTEHKNQFPSVDEAKVILGKRSTVDKVVPKINIYAGTNENTHLSNFAIRPFTHTWKDGKTTVFQSVEQAFQFAKARMANDRETAKKILATTNGAALRTLGKSIKGLDSASWDKTSSNFMETFIKESFEQNPQAAQALIDTGNATLTHTQDKGKWGTEFPRILMKVRSELRIEEELNFDTVAKEIQNRTYPVSPAFVQKILNACKTAGVKILSIKRKTEDRGRYLEDLNAIHLYKDENYNTSLHELTHAVTAYLFNEYITLPESIQAEVSKVQEIYNFLEDKFIKDNFYENGKLKDGIDIDKAFDFHTNDNDTYGFKSVKELIAEFVSNTSFREYLDNEGYGKAYKESTGKDLNKELTSLIGSLIDKMDTSIKKEAQAQMQNLKSNLNKLKTDENVINLDITKKAPFLSQIEEIANNHIGDLVLPQESLKYIIIAPKAKAKYLTHSEAKGTLIKMNFGEGVATFMLTGPAKISGENITLPLTFIGEDYLRTHLLNTVVNDKAVTRMSEQQLKEFDEQGHIGFNNIQNQDNPENFNNEEKSEKILNSEKTILSNEELTYWNEQGVGPKPRILVGSERTDPAFHVEEILDVLEGKTSVNEWGIVNGKRQVVKQVSGKDFAGLYLITKHDGLPMLKLLETKIPKLIHFSITGLGGTQYEPGVMKFNDLLDRIQDYIAQGLDPNCITIRIDPIVPGVTKFEDIETIVKRASEMGIKRIRFSVMDAYPNTKAAMSSLGYDFDKYYGGNFFAKKNYIDEIADFMLSMAKKYNVTLGTCAESLVRAGISKEGCLSVGAVNNMLGTSIEDKGTDNNDQRKLCSCYGGKIDALQYNNKCASHCIYCYAKHENDKVLEYYNEDGTLKNNMFTQTRKVKTLQDEERNTIATTNTSSVTKIISGGQTGVDTIGLQVAKKLGIKTGGTAPRGYVREDNSDKEDIRAYGLQEISEEEQANYTERTGKKDAYTGRTELNVRNSDGTVYFATDTDSAGKIATERATKEWNKPFLLNPTARQLREWLDANNIKTLNIAGNRGSKLPANNKVAQIIETALRITPQNSQANSTQPTQSISVTQENFKPEYQLDRSKLEADTRYDQLRKDMSSRTIELRAQHIAREFADKVMPMLDDAIATAEEERLRLMKEGPYKNRKELLSLATKIYKLNLIKASEDRIKAIQAIGPEAIFKAVKEELQEYADMSEEDFVNETDLDASKQAEYKKFVKNFDALQNYALYYINMREGVKIEEDETDSEEKRIAEGNTGWGFKVRFTDPYTTSSAITKHLLNSLSMLDKNGDVVFDDLGNVITLTGNYAHSALMHELSKIKEPSDFVEYDTNGKPSFPALEDMVAKYPWVEQLIRKLRSNPEIISTVFNDFRQDFISYWVVVKDKKTGKLITKRVNHATAQEAVVPLVEHNFEYGELQSDNSIFNTNRQIVKENIIKAQALSEAATEAEEAGTQEGYDTLVSSVTELLRMTGFSIEETDIEAVLNGTEDITQIRDILSSIDNFLSEVSRYKGTNLIEDYKSRFYNPVADIVGKVNPELTLDSFRDHGKSYYSYSAPNFLNTLVKHLKDMDGDKRRAYMDKHFKQYKWYYDEKTGWKSEWLRAFYEDNGVSDRRALDVMNLLAIEGNEYRDWTMGNIMKGFITAYFGANSDDFAWYNTPIFADSPMANLIKMRKIKGKDNADMKKTLLDRFETVVRQELWRMRLVEERKDKVTPIVNWDVIEKNGKRGKDGGNTFFFFPELNDYVTKEGDTFFEAYNKLAATYAQNQNVTQFQRDLKSLIQTAVSKIMENNYTSFRTDVAKEGVENELKESIVPESMKTQDAKDSYFEDALEEYYWNNAYAQTQIIELTTVDPAFYKNDGGVDFQKRFKEIYAAGSRLNTALPYDEGGRKYERTIYIADDIRISPSYKDIEQGLRKAADEKKFGNDVKMGHAVVDDILFKFRDINSTDGQAYRSLKSFRSVVKMLGKWNDKMEEAYNRFRARTWEMSDFYVVWNTIKPYVFTIDDVPTGVDEAKYGKTMPVPHQNKNSEFLLLAMYGLLAEKAGISPQMRGINRFMEDYDIDVVQFESAAKVGGQGIVNLNYSRTALAAKGYDSYSKYQDDLYAKLKAGKITQEQFNQAMDDILPSEEEVIQILKDAALKARDDKFIVKDEKTGQTYNAEVVHSHSYDDYMIAQPTPEHLFDTETVFGSQINALITADLPADFSVTINGKTYDKNGIRKFYKSLKVENLLEDFQKIKDRFKSIEDFQKALEETIKDNPKYGREVLDAIQLVPDGHGGKMFNIPLNNPSTTIKLQEVVTSMFKNSVTKQKIKGGANILVSNFGYTNQLKLVYNKEGDAASGIKYAECYMPAWSKKYFREFMDENGNIDIDKIPDNLKEMVVYRIPTEHKYSMLPIKIVGFLPIQNGSCMMLPMETVAQAGEDFDVDKKFVFMPEFEPPTFKGKKKQQFIEDFIKYKEGQGVKVSKDAVRQAADMIEADIESDEGTLEAEASDFYWDNYKEYGLNQIRKIEYDHTKTPAQNTRAQRNNMLIDIIRGILTSPQVVEQVNHAGNYDHVKKASRLSRIVNDPILVEAYMQEKKIANLDELAEHFLNADLDTLDDFMKKHKKAFNWLDPRTFMYFHRQNMAGDALIGLYANNSVAHAKYQEFGIGIHGDFQFTINGVRMDSISKMRTADGTLISFNNAEFLAAAPDNAKDPVLADLMQNPNTANLTAAMLRMGMNIQDIGLLFNQPTIKDLIEQGALDTLPRVLEDYIKYVKTFYGAYRLPSNPYITSKELLMNILNDKVLDELEDSETSENTEETSENPENSEELKRMKQQAIALSKTLPALQVMVNIQRIADDLSTLTNMSRADSTNGAIATTVAQALNQKRKVEVFTKKAAAGKTAITNVEGVIKNGKITADMDIDEMRMHLDDGDVAMLQAFYSLGIEMALPLMARYFPQVSQAVEDIFNIVSDNAPRQMIPQTKSKKTPYSVDQLLKDITTFALSGTKMFGDDGVNTYEQKRNYYIYEFPKKFVEILEQNPDLENIATLKKLVVKQGKIQFDNQGKMSTHTRNNLMSELDLLLTSENPVAQELLEDLIKYSYYTEQLNFGPKSFGTFISPKVLNAFPEFAQTLRDIPIIMSRPTAITRFIDQMYAQNVGGMLKTYMDYKKLEDGTIEQSFEGKDAEASDYLAFLEDHPTLTTEITTIEDGKTVKKRVPKKVPVAYKLARSYREESENITIGVYEKVGLFINSDGIRYNMNMDASDMAKQPFDAKKWAALQSLYGRQQRETEGMRRAEEERAKMWEMDGIDYMEDNDFDIDAQEVEQELDSEPNFDVDAMGDFDAFFAQKEENNTYNIDESIATLDREMC